MASWSFPSPAASAGQGHNGDTLWFHSSLVTIPQLGLGIFVTTNTDTGDRLAAELPKRIVGQFLWPLDRVAPTGRSGSAG